MNARKTYRNLKNFCRGFVFLFLLLTYFKCKEGQTSTCSPFICEPLPPALCTKALEPLTLELWLHLSWKQTQGTLEIRPTHCHWPLPWVVAGCECPRPQMVTDSSTGLLLKGSYFRSTLLGFFVPLLILVSQPTVEVTVFGRQNHCVLILGSWTRFLSSSSLPFIPFKIKMNRSICCRGLKMSQDLTQRQWQFT